MVLRRAGQAQGTEEPGLWAKSQSVGADCVHEEGKEEGQRQRLLLSRVRAHFA